VTGADGFTGRHFAAEAANFGHEVIPLKTNLNDVTSLNQEVLSIAPNAVVHLAAITFVAHDDVDEIYQVNVIGTRNLLQALANLKSVPRAVLLASSANVYGNSFVEMIDESTAASPANDYAVSKLAMEYMAKLWMDRLPIFITRPFNYSGVGQSLQFLLPKIVDHFQRGERVIELGNVDIERDFSDVRFVAKAYLELLEKCPIGETVNICSGRANSLKDVLNTMNNIAGYDIEVHTNPLFVRSNDVKKLFGSNQKLKSFVPELPDISLRETLSWMYQADK
jgi:nucleoside-diphosphate-sugar epimerase